MKLHTLDEATEILLNGGVGVWATDTVYALVARVANQKAVERLYAIKRRQRKPGIVSAADVDQLIQFGVDKHYIDVVKQWWPGSLSLETSITPGYLDQGTGHCAWHVVANPKICEVLKKTGLVVGSSANQPGEPTSITVQQAYGYFGDTVDFYVDADDLSGRLPTTVVRIVDGAIEVIRQGAVDIDK